MLDFYYGFFQKYLMWDSFEMVEMDTDSTYFAFAYETLNEGVKQGISKNEWEAAKKNIWCWIKVKKELQGYSKRSGLGKGWFVLIQKHTLVGVRKQNVVRKV